MVVSPGYVLFVICKQDLTGAQDSFRFRVFHDLRMGLTPRPLLFSAGASSTTNLITVMHRHSLNTINYTDCICRPNTGRRNRYVRLSIYNRAILTDAYSRLTTGSNDTSAAQSGAAGPERMSRTEPRLRYNITKETAAFGGRIFHGMVFRLSNKTTREYDHNGRESCLFLRDTPAVTRVFLVILVMTAAWRHTSYRIKYGCGHRPIGFFMIKSE